MVLSPSRLLRRYAPRNDKNEALRAEKGLLRVLCVSFAVKLFYLSNGGLGAFTDRF